MNVVSENKSSKIEKYSKKKFLNFEIRKLTKISPYEL